MCMCTVCVPQSWFIRCRHRHRHPHRVSFFWLSHCVVPPKQREVRLTQLAEAVLTKLFRGEEASFGEEAVVWGQDGKETAGGWMEVVPVQGPLPPLWEQKGPKKPMPEPVPLVSRPSRLQPPPFYPPSDSSSGAGASSAAAAAAAESASGGGSGEGRGLAEESVVKEGDGAMVSGGGEGDRAAGSSTAGGFAAAASSRGSGLSAEGGAAGDGDRGSSSGADANSSRSSGGSSAGAGAEDTDTDTDTEGSFVLVVLEGSITAEYGLEEQEQRGQKQGRREGSASPDGDDHGGDGGGRRSKPMRKVRPRRRKDRVLRKGTLRRQRKSTVCG